MYREGPEGQYILVKRSKTAAAAISASRTEDNYLSYYKSFSFARLPIMLTKGRVPLAMISSLEVLEA